MCWKDRIKSPVFLFLEVIFIQIGTRPASAAFQLCAWRPALRSIREEESVLPGRRRGSAGVARISQHVAEAAVAQLLSAAIGHQNVAVLLMDFFGPGRELGSGSYIRSQRDRADAAKASSARRASGRRAQDVAVADQQRLGIAVLGVFAHEK